MLCYEVNQHWERLEISFVLGSRLDRVILLFLVSFSWLGDMVCSLIHDGDKNRGQLCLHTNKPLLCWNDPDRRFYCLSLTSGARRVSGSKSCIYRGVSSGPEGRMLHPQGHACLPALAGSASSVLYPLRPDQEAWTELLCSHLEVALTSFA